MKGEVMLKKNIILTIPLFLAVIFVLTDSIPAANSDIALVLKVSGEARLKSGDKQWEPLKRGYRLTSGDKIRTGRQALVAIVFTDDKSMMKIRAESEVTVRGTRDRKGIAKRVYMQAGNMWAKIQPGGRGYRLETPSGVAAVKGTEFYGIVDSFGSMTIIGIEGVLELFNDLGKVMVNKGQTGKAGKGSKPAVTETEQLDDWAKDGDIEELIIEFENNDKIKKQLKLRYRTKN